MAKDQVNFIEDCSPTLFSQPAISPTNFSASVSIEKNITMTDNSVGEMASQENSIAPQSSMKFT